MHYYYYSPFLSLVVQVKGWSRLPVATPARRRGGAVVASRRRTPKQLPKLRHTRLSAEDVDGDAVFSL
jgi:hypothetical protein